MSRQNIQNFPIFPCSLEIETNIFKMQYLVFVGYCSFGCGFWFHCRSFEIKQNCALTWKLANRTNGWFIVLVKHNYFSSMVVVVHTYITDEVVSLTSTHFRLMQEVKLMTSFKRLLKVLMPPTEWVSLFYTSQFIQSSCTASVLYLYICNY